MNEDFERQLLLESKEKASEKLEKDNPYLTRDPNDGTLYEWDPIRKAWFPKIDQDFIAYYQAANYHYQETETDDNKKLLENVEKKTELSEKTENEKNESEKNESEDKINESEKKNEKTEIDTANDIKKGTASKTKPVPTWFTIEEENNTKVYVSNLPNDVTDEEFVDLMQKCGLVMKDLETNKFKIKLYKDKDGNLKGDGLCTYIKQESVTLALQILDGYIFKDKELKVEIAKFELKGEYDPSKKPKKRKAADKEKIKKKMNRLFGWQPDKLPNQRSKREKVVIIKNVFDIKEFDENPTLVTEYRQDVHEECTEKCGPVRKVDVYDRNPEGVVAVFFNEFEHADQCVELMNGRFYGGRQLSAENWDGITKFKVAETEEEAAKRIKEWNKFLENE